MYKKIATAKIAKMTRMTEDEINTLSKKIIGLTIEVHKNLGPGFVEKIYQKALVYELKKNGINFVEEANIGVHYKNLELGYQRIDFMIENEVMIELKSVSEINEIHEAQMISYLKTTNKRLGLILNFAKKRLDIKRIVNNL
ncbi:MAG: GxxExxY protein [Candidatus Omnitrophota bacterium]